MMLKLSLVGALGVVLSTVGVFAGQDHQHQGYFQYANVPAYGQVRRSSGTSLINFPKIFHLNSTNLDTIVEIHTITPVATNRVTIGDSELK